MGWTPPPDDGINVPEWKRQQLLDLGRSVHPIGYGARAEPLQARALVAQLAEALDWGPVHAAVDLHALRLAARPTIPKLRAEQSDDLRVA